MVRTAVPCSGASKFHLDDAPLEAVSSSSEPAAPLVKAKFNGHWISLLLDVLTWGFYTMLMIGVSMPKTRRLRSGYEVENDAKSILIILGAVFFCVTYAAKWILAFCSLRSVGKTVSMLRDDRKLTVEGAIARLRALQAAQPVMVWHIKCYHMEAHTVYVTMSDGRGGSHQVPTTVRLGVDRR
jgi:hypothetical protein